MFTDFKRPEIEDRELINSFLKQNRVEICDMTFANIYLWSRHYRTTFAIYKNTLLFHSDLDGYCSYTFPLGKEEDVRAVIDEILAYCEGQVCRFQLHLVTPKQYEWLEANYPGRFCYETIRDKADYVYEQEKLATLAGKKLHSKRNHINRFEENHPDWTYEEIDHSNVEECFQMAMEWRSENEAEADEEMKAEVAVTMNYLRLMDELGMRGGLIRTQGRVIAFSIGEPLNDDTMVVHIEKAFSEIQGAYPIINREFARHACAGFRYVNREEDTGEEGLRKAKLSYKPIFLSEKGVVSLMPQEG
ncbi:MAG: phosphatidylglycerol lysyltransferase domain-containing protein [Eubacteriales bacterium]|nr:phosphatidylglycerol lysyltransferase domain-containing protein [Eubacteriales bacterium]